MVMIDQSRRDVLQPKYIGESSGSPSSALRYWAAVAPGEEVNVVPVSR